MAQGPQQIDDRGFAATLFRRSDGQAGRMLELTIDMRMHCPSRQRRCLRLAYDQVPVEGSPYFVEQSAGMRVHANGAAA